MTGRAYRLPLTVDALCDRFKLLHTRVRQAALGSIEAGGAHEVDRETSADTIFKIDKHVDPILEAFFEDWGQELPLVLIAEGLEQGSTDSGLGEGVRLFGCKAVNDARIVVIVDPIDGTRGLMYDKRPAWMLCGVAAMTKHWPARLSDIDFAYMGELPTSKQAMVDSWWAGRGLGAQGERFNLYTNASRKMAPAPSSARSFDKGFAMLSKFFPFGKPLLAEVEHRMLGALGHVNGSAVVFDDQYICSGGQLAELIQGKDRFNADLRCWAYNALGEPQGLCVHPYDLASVLVAEEAGVLVTDAKGDPLDAPLDCTTGVDWVGYANAQLKDLAEPKLLEAMQICRGPVPRLLDEFPEEPTWGCNFERKELLASFMSIDKHKSGLIHRADFERVMKGLDSSFEDEKLIMILEGAGCGEDDKNVNYMKLVDWLYP